jgi:hypothetical protein
MPSDREVLQYAFAQTAKGDGRPFVEMLADVEWSIIGSTEWSQTFRGKREVVDDLLRPLADQFQGPNTVAATRFIGEAEVIVVEGRNLSVTNSGAAYPNRYCWIFEMRDGRVTKITEYCDTALVDRVLVRPSKDAHAS